MHTPLLPLLLSLILLSLPLGWIPQAAAEEAKPKPCTAPAYRQFDFWQGEWTSYTEDGEEQGSNHIHAIMNGCGLQENWSGRGGQYQGTSYNFYDRVSGNWHQTWVDNQGGHLFLSGKFDGTSMQLSGRQASPKGEVINRITWTPLEDGRVRQHWETSSDDGATWSTVFNGFYQRKR